MPAAKDTGTIEVPKIEAGVQTIHVVGTSPFICNRMSEKAWRELLLPAPRKNAAAKASSLKHDPFAEFAASPYTLADDNDPTLIAVMSSAFKGAMATAALDLPGTKKAQIGRLCYVLGDYVPIYGIPQILSSIVRSADMNRTPDVRTRAILPTWAATFDVQYVTPILKAQSVVNLLAAGGVSAGIGDWRPEKGKGSYGTFRVTADSDPDFIKIVKKGGRSEQRDAMQNPSPYDQETSDLLQWFEGEAKERGFRN